MEPGPISIHAIIIAVSTTVGSFFGFRYLMRKKKENRIMEREDRIKKDGVEFTAAEVGLGFDPKLASKDKRMPCCLTADWTDPDSGQTHELKSQWFWYNPRNKENKIDFKDIKGWVIPGDPTMCHMDISEYKLHPYLH